MKAKIILFVPNEKVIEKITFNYNSKIQNNKSPEINRGMVFENFLFCRVVFVHVFALNWQSIVE